MIGKMDNFGGYVWLFWGCGGGPGGPYGNITPPRCGWVGMMKNNVAGVGIGGWVTLLYL